MRAVLQRVSEASVSINNEIKTNIQNGLLVLLGIEPEDKQSDIDWLCKKIVNMRIFNDDADKMNRSIKDIDGDLILVSQFTLHAKTKKGNRPSFIRAAKPDVAIPLYEQMIEALSQVLGKPVGTGEFGADMQVQLINDGPVTIIIDSKQKDF